MSNTTNFNLVKPAETDIYNVLTFNGNMDIIDAEMAKPPLTINGIAPDPVTRDTTVTEVPLAGNLSSDIAQIVTGSFIERTSGGDASIDDGSAFLVSLKGNCVHTGVVQEVLTYDVQAVERENPITATLNETTFKAYVTQSATITLTYIASWSADPALYGLTITGTPVNGDTIVITYVKGDLGTITPATPSAFSSTGWNLFSSTAGYAKVVRYSDEYGYRIGGNYSLVSFAETISGTQQAITMEDGLFNVPSDGYVFVTGYDATTYIYPTWSDWTEGYEGEFAAYSVDTISLSEAMLNFPYGLCSVGIVRDEINLNAQTAIQRIERLANTAENLEDVVAMGVPYDYDTNYIYYALETPVTTALTIDGEYTVSDHGIEFFTGTTIPVYTETLYGENLKDKLRTDVLTISPQELTYSQQLQVRQNIGAASLNEVPSVGLLSTTAGAKVTKTGVGNNNVPFLYGKLLFMPIDITVGNSAVTAWSDVVMTINYDLTNIAFTAQICAAEFFKFSNETGVGYLYAQKSNNKINIVSSAPLTASTRYKGFVIIVIA